MNRENLDSEIYNENKVPGSPSGCDSFTRPEEISALSKFLKHVREVQEEHTELGKDNLVVPIGDSTGKFPIIEKLEDEISIMPEHIDESEFSREEFLSKLQNRLVSGLPSENEEKEKLEKRLINLLKNQSEETITELETEIVVRPDNDLSKKSEIENNTGELIEELPDNKIGLIDDRNINLDDTVVELEITEEEELEDTQIKLDGISEVELEDNKEILEVKEKVHSLEDEKILLDDISEVSDLKDKKILLENISEVSGLKDEKILLEDISDVNELSNIIENLEINKDPELIDNRVDLEVPSEIELENELVNLENTESDIKLEDSIEKIEVNEDLDLSQSLVDLDVKENLELSDSIIDLEVSDEVELSNTLISGDWDDEITSLEDFISGIDNYRDEDIDLYKGKESLHVEEKTRLSSTIENLLIGNKDIKLENEVEELVGKIEEVKLKDSITTLDGVFDKEVNLSDTKEVLDFSLINDIPALSKYIKKIDVDSKDIDLESDYIKLEETKDGPRREGDYSFFQNDQEKSQEVDLPGEKENLSQATKPENDDDYFYFDPNVEGNKLYDAVIEAPNLENDPEEVLKKKVEKLEESKTGPRKLDHYDYFQNEEEIKSGEVLRAGDIQIPLATAPGNNSDRYKYIDIIENGNEGELYESIMEFGMLKDASGKVDGNQTNFGMSGWLSKVKSLVQAYLIPGNPDNKKVLDISEHRAKQFEQHINKETNLALEVMKKSLSVGKFKEDAPEYKLPDFSIKGFNFNDYLRYAAEKIVGLASKLIGDRTVRQLLLKETLALLVWARDELEIATDSYRSRLPGNTGILSTIIQGGASLDSLKKAAISTVGELIGTKNSLENPINRPEKDKETKEIRTLGWKKGNNRPDNIVEDSNPDSSSNSSKGGFLNKLKDFTMGSSPEMDYSFEKSYLVNDLGLQTTLKDLIGATPDIFNSVSVEDLFDLFKYSDNITTSNNITTNNLGEYKVMTLDTNNYWEITLEPYVGSLNGNYTFLPFFEETLIDVEKRHGYKRLTKEQPYFRGWIPITSFELQKEKLVNKTIGLFDGEISYPTSVELTNELRLTIVDDQYKTWRRYFETCLNCMVYACTPKLYIATPADKYSRPKKYTQEEIAQAQEDYEAGLRDSPIYDEVYFVDGNLIRRGNNNYDYFGGYSEGLTEINKNYQLISSYKNICFICKIYVMTPQKSTINKYSLLLTLKDFSEERSGEIDGSGTDLSLSFSIVGENPVDRLNAFSSDVTDMKSEAKKSRDEAKQQEKARKAGNLTSGVMNSVASLI